MHRLQRYIKQNPKFTTSFIIIVVSILLMLKFGFDKKAIAIITIIFGFVTNIFVGLLGLLSMIPIVGPLVVKVLTIPFFWLLNGAGYFTSAIAIKKGYGKDVALHRIVVISLLFGIVVGYVLGHLIPMR